MEQVLDEFNAFVRGPMREKLVDAIGGEVWIPARVAYSVSLPMIICQVLLTFGCEFGSCEAAAVREGFASADQYFLCNIIM